MYFTIYQDVAGGWRWTLYAENHRKIADSGESYVQKAGTATCTTTKKSVARKSDYPKEAPRGSYHRSRATPKTVGLRSPQ